MTEEELKIRIEKIMRRRLEKLKWLKSCCEQVIACSNNTLKKIDSDGLRNNFSCNHDIQKWAERVHRVSYELWLLSDIQKLVEEGIEVTEVFVEEDKEIAGETS